MQNFVYKRRNRIFFVENRVNLLVLWYAVCSLRKELVYAVELVLSDEEYLLYMTKRLYPDIGKHFHTSASNVERSIRTIVTICWNEGNRELLDHIAGYRLLRKPTTGEFISILAFHLKVQS